MEISATKNPILPFHVLIPAAGSGVRMGGDLPKQYQTIAGKTILRHTIEQFMHCPGIQSLCVVIDPAHTALYARAVEGLDLLEPVFGSDSRKSSIYNGLKSFYNLKNEEIILIHDAARPFIGHDEILTLVAEMQNIEAATLGIPVADTMRRSDDNENAGPVVDRQGLWAIQTPQAFRYGTIMAAHQKVGGDAETPYTDDSMLVSAAGVDVAIIKGHKRNFKITTADDLELARALIGARQQWETRSASGYDVHAFAEDGDHVVLGGVQIPSDRSLKGHSDADVGLHAITDALLGTIAAGDIGTHFPPSDPQWKGADSGLFLEHAIQLVREKGGEIRHIDLTLICEMPKIGPYRPAMTERIAKICGITPDRVSVKATTTEGLGFTGRSEGIAAQAMATIILPMGSRGTDVF